MSLPSVTPSVLALTLLLGGCGANVVFGEDGNQAGGGEGGAGASGASGPGTGATGPGTGGAPTTTSSMTTDNSTVNTTVGPGNLCEQLCNDFPQCVGGNCIQECNGVFVPGCERQAASLLECYVGNLQPNCELSGNACQFEIDQFSQCVGTTEGCSTDFCEGGMGGSCTCFGQCFDVDIQQDCNDQGPGPTANCDCFFNGQFGGSCQMDFLECSIEGGCCQFLLEGGVGGGPQ